MCFVVARELEEHLKYEKDKTRLKLQEEGVSFVIKENT
jgi:hypothetical protein